jgi:hypothetical protein
MSATDFTRSASSALTASIEGASSAEEIRELCKSQLVADGVLDRERGNGYGDTLTKEAENAVPAFTPSDTAVPSAPRRETCIRVIFPGGNDQYEICGVSEEELDAKEAKIRAMYARK